MIAVFKCVLDGGGEGGMLSLTSLATPGFIGEEPLVNIVMLVLPFSDMEKHMNVQTMFV